MMPRRVPASLCRLDLARLIWTDCWARSALAAPAKARGALAAPAQAVYRPFCDVTEVFVGAGRVVRGAVVGGAVGLVGKVVQAFEASGLDTWSAGTVATAAPLRSTPTTVAPASSELPGTASTTMPELGAMASTAVAPDDRWTDATPLPTQTATQPTGAPSAVPKEPTPRSSTVTGEGAAMVGRGTEPLQI